MFDYKLMLIILFFWIIFGLKYANSNFNRYTRAVFEKKMNKWINDTIPYSINFTTYNYNDLAKLYKAMKAWENETCIKFREAINGDTNWVEIIGGNSCSSQLAGMNKYGRQYLILSHYKCDSYGTYVHELAHVIGLQHEHRRPERDNYIKINKILISPDYINQFDKFKYKEINTEHTLYDLQSIVHYGEEVHTPPSKKFKISAINPNYQKLILHSSYKDMSFWDVRAVNSHYKCDRYCVNKVKCNYPNYIDQNCNCQTPESFIKRRCVNDLNDDDCYLYARSGYCLDYISFMSMNCRKSCNYCYQNDINKAGITNNLPCKDIASNCVGYYQFGLCTTMDLWMHIYCAKSCKFCLSSTSDKY